MAEAEEKEDARIDKWLWAARFYRTRSQAAEAVNGGKVHLNGARTKPAKLLRVGDVLTITKAPYEFIISVRELSRQRGPAGKAGTLYEETADSLRRRTELKEQMRLQPGPVPVKGPMTKKQRREMIRVKRGEFF